MLAQVLRNLEKCRCLSGTAWCSDKKELQEIGNLLEIRIKCLETFETREKGR